jgi:glucosamine--fructose-6-phosphate aminotransferase (isomerizing)
MVAISLVLIFEGLLPLISPLKWREMFSHRKEINIVNFPVDPKKITKVNLIACGTAYHACAVGKYWFEEFTNIDVSVDVASEFRYRNNKIKTNELYIFVSQSGETADTW